MNERFWSPLPVSCSRVGARVRKLDNAQDDLPEKNREAVLVRLLLEVFLSDK